MERICVHSGNVVAREIQGEIILVPIASGIGDLEDELYTLNETGRAIWERLDGKKSSGDVALELAFEFGGTQEEIERDVKGFVSELLKRGMLVEVTPETANER